MKHPRYGISTVDDWILLSERWIIDQNEEKHRNYIRLYQTNNEVHE